MRYLLLLVVALTVGISFGFFMSQSDLLNLGIHNTKSKDKSEILYWVAPMDANYRRDKPGQSPMGMDLVPFYAKKERTEPNIKYWVAPMDANYRRDEPGLSPMGMDLVPVYEESNDDNEEGTVLISSAVENNLGVRTAIVKKGVFDLTIKSLGNVQVNEDALWQINSRVSGWIEKLYVKSIGIEVEEGQKLYSLYSPELVKAQESLLNALNLKRDALINSSKLRLSALGVSAKQIKELMRDKKVMPRIDVYAPKKGTLTDLNVNEGAFISPSTTVVTAVDLDTVWVDAEVFSAQVSLVKLGDIATMTLDYFPGKEWLGKVGFIYPEMSQSNRTLRVRLQFDNPNQILKPNMFASVVITPRVNKEHLQIPREAVIYAGNMNRVVLALGEGKFRSVLVKVGLENDRTIEILSGLEVGQKIVTSAQFLLDSESSLSADFERMLEQQEISEKNDFEKQSSLNDNLTPFQETINYLNAFEDLNHSTRLHLFASDALQNTPFYTSKRGEIL